MKLITVVGARPQFIKAATLSRSIIRHNNLHRRVVVDEKIVHTGQHYDPNMSSVFFEALGIPDPSYSLHVGSGSHGSQTGRMLEKLEVIFMEQKPDVVLVYGDTNSTLAGALAAAKLHIPVAHVESGLRSYNRKMPEETNRVLVDHLSQILFCPSLNAVKNLANEGIFNGVTNVGDVMFDGVLHYRDQIARQPRALEQLGLEAKAFYLATVHRAENTDSVDRLSAIFASFGQLDVRYPVIVALHPRTRNYLALHGVAVPAAVRLIEPLPYFDMMELEIAARVILTDSGGVQKEAFFSRTPCVTLRDETEWEETLACKANVLCGASTTAIVSACMDFESGRVLPNFDAKPYGAGDSAEKIVAALIAFAPSAIQ